LLRFPCGHLLSILLTAFFTAFRSRAALQIEILVLRHQLSVLQRSVKRPKLTPADRFLWAWLSSTWFNWRSALILVQPETVIAWHRKGFRLFWTWKSRHVRRSRPSTPVETRKLIRRRSREAAAQHPPTTGPSVRLTAGEEVPGLLNDCDNIHRAQRSRSTARGFHSTSASPPPL
jgi:hypothetical protein